MPTTQYDFGNIPSFNNFWCYFYKLHHINVQPGRLATVNWQPFSCLSVARGRLNLIDNAFYLAQDGSSLGFAYRNPRRPRTNA